MLHCTDCLAVFKSLVEGISKMSTFGDTAGRENLNFFYQNYETSSLQYVTNAREFMGQLSSVNILHDTDYLPVFKTLVQGISKMSSFGGTAGRENLNFP